MTQPPLLPPPTPPDRRKITPLRVLIWIAVAAVGVFLLVSGAMGILAKG